MGECQTMQLTGGQFKGRKIVTPKGVRPTLSIVRESVFNILYSHFGTFGEMNFLDMFLGSGIMTFEALSRGFKTVSCEINPQVIKCANENVQELNLCPKFLRGDSLKLVKKINEKFSVIYADPPWDYSYLQIFQAAADLLLQDGILIAECDKKKKPDVLFELGKVNTLELFREKNYGRCCLLFVKLNR